MARYYLNEICCLYWEVVDRKRNKVVSTLEKTCDDSNRDVAMRRVRWWNKRDRQRTQEAK